MCAISIDINMNDFILLKNDFPFLVHERPNGWEFEGGRGVLVDRSALECCIWVLYICVIMDFRYICWSPSTDQSSMSGWWKSYFMGD